MVEGFAAFVQAAGVTDRTAHLIHRDLLSLGAQHVYEVTLEDRRRPVLILLGLDVPPGVVIFCVCHFLFS
jgi:hypothetical protein